MGYWGWRRMCAVFVSVWVVGCSITHNTAPTNAPTQIPLVTLTLLAPNATAPPPPTFTPFTIIEPSPTPVVYTIQPGDTLSAIALQFGVDVNGLQTLNGLLNPLALPIGKQIVIPSARFNEQGIPILPTSTPIVLDLTTPVCSPTTTGAIVCLGQVVNHQPSPVERVLIRVRLLRSDGSVLAESDVGLEQDHVLAEGFAPYRVLFKADWQEYGGAAAFIYSADLVSSTLTLVEVQSQFASLRDGQYIIHATLHNPQTQAVRLLRAILTLQDANEQIIGYRVVPLYKIIEGEADFALHINLMTGAAPPIRHVLYIEADIA